MNKKVLFYRLFVLVVLIIGVGSYIVMNEKINVLESRIAEHNNSEPQIKESSFYGDYQGNDEFSDIISENPIDKDYERELEKLQKSDEANTLAWGAFETKYLTKWQDEVRAALKYLYKSLDEKDRINLERSQKSWQSYVDGDIDFVSDKFVYTGYFGSQGKVQLVAVELHRTRERAIELKEYIFSMDKTAVNFVYDQ